MSVPVNPYVVIHDHTLGTTPWVVMDVRTGNTVHTAYDIAASTPYHAERKPAARMAAVWNRCFQEEWASQHSDDA